MLGHFRILIVLAFAIGFGQTTGWTAEQPAGNAAGTDSPGSVQSGGMTDMFEGTVMEMIDAGRYVYLDIQAGAQRVWVAVPAYDGRLGDRVLVPPGVPVADFHSRRLHRRFKMIYFVGSVRQAGKRPAD